VRHLKLACYLIANVLILGTYLVIFAAA